MLKRPNPFVLWETVVSKNQVGSCDVQGCGNFFWITFLRVTLAIASESFILVYLQITESKCQVVNIGAGFDTLFWNLKKEGSAPSSFIEIDFPDVTMKKCHFIKTKQPLLEVIHSEGISDKSVFAD